jgi:hypothetical protein
MIPPPRPGRWIQAVVSRPAIRLLGLLLMIGASHPLLGQSVNLAWDASPNPAVTGYKIYWGTISGNYTNSKDAGTSTTLTISDLAAGITNYFSVTCYGAGGAQSGYSVPVAYAASKAAVLNPAGRPGKPSNPSAKNSTTGLQASSPPTPSSPSPGATTVFSASLATRLN